MEAKLGRGDNLSWKSFWENEKGLMFRPRGLVVGLEVDVFVGGVLAFPNHLVILG